jgi:hypothetical protein
MSKKRPRCICNTLLLRTGYSGQQQCAGQPATSNSGLAAGEAQSGQSQHPPTLPSARNHSFPHPHVCHATPLAPLQQQQGPSSSCKKYSKKGVFLPTRVWWTFSHLGTEKFHSLTEVAFLLFFVFFLQVIVYFLYLCRPSEVRPGTVPSRVATHLGPDRVCVGGLGRSSIQTRAYCIAVNSATTEPPLFLNLLR